MNANDSSLAKLHADEDGKFLFGRSFKGNYFIVISSVIGDKFTQNCF
jgi:hypothetical protein